MTIFDEIPTTKQGLLLYRNYAENEVKRLKLLIKRFDKLSGELQRRLELMRDAEVGCVIGNKETK
jgi:hypothetical protein